VAPGCQILKCDAIAIMWVAGISECGGFVWFIFLRLFAVSDFSDPVPCVERV